MKQSVIIGSILFTQYTKYSFTTGTDEKEVPSNAIKGELGSILEIPAYVTYNTKNYPVKRIGKSSFSSATITEVIIPITIESLGSLAFWNCSKITKLTFLPGSHLKTIEFKALDILRVSSIHLPATIESFEDTAFWGLNSLIDLTYCGDRYIANILCDACNKLEYIVVHYSYKHESFGGFPVNRSESLNCPSVVHQNFYSFLYSYKCRTNQTLHFCIILVLLYFKS